MDEPVGDTSPPYWLYGKAVLAGQPEPAYWLVLQAPARPTEVETTAARWMALPPTACAQGCGDRGRGG